MRSSAHLTARRLGFALVLGTALVAVEDVRTIPRRLDEARPVERRPRVQRPHPARRFRPVPAPPPPEPLERGLHDVVETPAPADAPVDSRRRTVRLVKAVLFAAGLAAWLWFMLPQSLGGRAGWVLVDGTSMLPHYHTGDLVLVERQSHYHVGEVVAYRVPEGDPMAGAQVIHRIVGGDAVHGFVVEGDNRTAPDIWRPTAHDVVGVELLRIPHALVVLRWLRSPLLLGMLAAAFVFAKVLTGGGRGGTPRDADA